MDVVPIVLYMPKALQAEKRICTENTFPCLLVKKRVVTPEGEPGLGGGDRDRFSRETT